MKRHYSITTWEGSVLEMAWLSDHEVRRRFETAAFVYRQPIYLVDDTNNVIHSISNFLEYLNN